MQIFSINLIHEKNILRVVGNSFLYKTWHIDTKSGMSLNHIMFGEISARMYKPIRGIKPILLHP